MKIIKIDDKHYLWEPLSSIDSCDEQIKHFQSKRDSSVEEINNYLTKLEGQKIMDCEYNKTTKEIRYMTESCVEEDDFKLVKHSRKSKKH